MSLPYDPAQIARRHGTPTYVYDAATIHRQVDALQREGVTIRYAQKANSNLAVLALMRSRGVVVDAVTAGEVHRALKAGFDPSDVVFTADLLDADALAVLSAHRCPVNCGSADMLDTLAEAGLEDLPVTLRLNPGFGHGHSRKVNTGGPSSKHGIWQAQLPETLDRAHALGLRVRGLHMHIGSGADFDHLAKVCDAMEQAADVFVKHASSRPGQLEVISAGGGLPIDYHRHTAAAAAGPESASASAFDVERFLVLWLATRDRIRETAGGGVELEVEPGRFLVAEAGTLLTRVRALKLQGEGAGAQRYVLIDAGFNDLVRPSFYGAFHHVSVYEPGGSARVGEAAAAIAGPLCESCDVFTQNEDGVVQTRTMADAQVGDLLVLHDAGAYGFAMASNYNSRRLAEEVMIVEGQPHTVRARQPVEDLYRLESIPEGVERPALAV